MDFQLLNEIHGSLLQSYALRSTCTTTKQKIGQ
jgi:hypothetical protein